MKNGNGTWYQVDAIRVNLGINYLETYRVIDMDTLIHILIDIRTPWTRKGAMTLSIYFYFYLILHMKPSCLLIFLFTFVLIMTGFLSTISIQKCPFFLSFVFI